MANAFESEIKKSADLLELHYRKIPVPTKLSVRDERTHLVKLRKPGYDGYFVYGGRHIAVELKSSTLFGSFPLCRIPPHQRDGLREINERGCPAWLLINMRWEMREKKKRVNNRAWAFLWNNWEYLLETLGSSKSVPAQMLLNERWFMPIPRIHVPDQAGKNVLCWDVRSFLDH